MNIKEIETTTDIVIVAHDILLQAELVKNEVEHNNVLDLKVELLNKINNCLETGGFYGQAYDELHEAKHLLYRSEKIADERVENNV